MAEAAPGGMRRRNRTYRFVLPALLLLFVSFGVFAADDRMQGIRDRLDAIRLEFDRIEETLARMDDQPDALVGLRGQAEPLRAELRAVIAGLEPLHQQTESRLKELGAPPEPDQPLEAPAIAAEREQQSAQLRELDAALRQTRLLSVRGAQIVDRIDQRRRAAFTSLLFARAVSVFAPSLWLDAARALPWELRGLQTMFGDWRNHIAERAGAGPFTLALVLSFAAVGGILLVRQTVRRRFDAAPRSPDAPPLPRQQKVLLAFRDAALDSLAAPAAALAVVEIFAAFGLMPDRIRLFGSGLVTAVAYVAVGRALARSAFAPGSPARRLPRFDDPTARDLYRLVSNAVILTAIALLVNVTHRALASPVEMTIATNATYAFLLALQIAYSLLKHREAPEDPAEHRFPPWIRLAGWAAVLVIGIALATGYLRFGSFVAERMVTAAIVLLGLYLLLAIVDAVLDRGLAADSPRRQSAAAMLGIQPRTLDVIATLFGGLLRAVLVLAAIFLIVGTFTTTVIDIGVFDPSALGIEIGRTQILLADVLAALVIFAVGLLVTRILYRWLARVLLPRTSMEASLQNSIATIAGYAGVIAAVSLALGRLGVNLENIALVAGALSIGIGFGLQSIVSNFVSGLILLTERPIRVGDWIVVGNEQGYVRKISVRSTEIETFERASVILPNSDLITGMVKNWTHADVLGRLSVPVGVSYNSDPDKVREILLASAREHPLVLKEPEPYVLFMKFGDSALEFELRGIVANVNQRLSVTSDLHFDIFRRFREAGIEIPFPQRDIHIRSAPSGGPIPAADASPKTKS